MAGSDVDEIGITQAWSTIGGYRVFIVALQEMKCVTSNTVEATTFDSNHGLPVGKRAVKTKAEIDQSP